MSYLLAIRHTSEKDEVGFVVVGDDGNPQALVTHDMVRHHLREMGIGTYPISTHAAVARVDLCNAQTTLGNVVENRHADRTLILDLLPKLTEALCKDLRR